MKINIGDWIRTMDGTFRIVKQRSEAVSMQVQPARYGNVRLILFYGPALKKKELKAGNQDTAAILSVNNINNFFFFVGIPIQE